jgi:hypothetical protein
MRCFVSAAGRGEVCLTSQQYHGRPAGLVDMHVADEGVVSVISFYLYGLIGLSLLVVISPLIIVAVGHPGDSVVADGAGAEVVDEGRE